MRLLAFAIAMLAASLVPLSSMAQPPSATTSAPRKLIPRYPGDRDCSPITSPFSSWDDVDGGKRDDPHSGIDLGRLDETVMAPAPGTVIAVWRANWGWGEEGAMLLRHSKADLGLEYGPNFYYSEFDHLRYDEIANVAVGRRVARGEPLAHVFRPGGDPGYLPEVHWEVWSIADDAATVWSHNEHGGLAWHNDTGHLVDPLYMLSLNGTIAADGSVPIHAFDAAHDYRRFRGFTYILPCPPIAVRR